MTPILFTVLILLALLALCLGALFCLMIWIAKGEPDTNGDPERDGARTALSASSTDQRLTALRQRISECPCASVPVGESPCPFPSLNSQPSTLN